MGKVGLLLEAGGRGIIPTSYIDLARLPVDDVSWAALGPRIQSVGSPRAAAVGRAGARPSCGSARRSRWVANRTGKL